MLQFHEKILEYNFWQEKWHTWKWTKNLKTYSVFSLEIGFCFMVVGVTRMVWATFWFFKVTMPPLPRVKVQEGFFNSGLFGVNFWILGGIWQTKGDFCGEVFGFSKSTVSTGKYLSEALIFLSSNPQDDNRMFIELRVQCMKIPSSELNMLWA